MSADGSPLHFGNHNQALTATLGYGRNMRSTNALEMIGYKNLNPKALFEQASHEGSSISGEERMNIFARMVWAGYHIKDEAYKYLSDKSSPKGDTRWEDVRFTLWSVGLDLIALLLDRVQKDRKNQDTQNWIAVFKKYTKKGSISHLPFDQCADALEEMLRACFSMRELLRAYLGERPPYKPLLSVEIDLEDTHLARKHCEQIDSSLALDDLAPFSFWTYQGVCASWYRTTLSLLKRAETYQLPNHIAEHTNPQMWNTPPCIPSELALAKKFFPEEDTELLKANKELWRERLLAYATKQAEVMYQQAPLFDEPVYLWYTNYTDKQALHTNRLWEEGVVSICIQDYSQTGVDELHQEYFDALSAGEQMVRPKQARYIQDFITLANKVKEQDVLIVASYKGYKEVRIGLIKQGSEFYIEQYDDYRFYCFKLKGAYCTPRWGAIWDSVSPSEIPILKSLSQHRATIAHVVNQRRREAVYRAYYGILYPYNHNLLSDEATEDMCRIWLASDHAEALYLPQPADMLGGTMPRVDIFGSHSGILKFAQVTTSSDYDTISKKEDKLIGIGVEGARYVMFANYMFGKDAEYWGEERYRISLERVWSDLYDDGDKYREQLQELCQLDYKRRK